MYKSISAISGESFIIDSDMHGYLFQWEWRVDQEGYAYRTGRIEDEDKFLQRIFMHQVVNNTPKDKLTDHRDRDVSNNTRENLRTCTPAENARNASPWRYKISEYKGITPSYEGSWRARIHFNGKSIHIGDYKCEKAAAEAYNKKALKLFEEFAYINKIEGHDDCVICKNVIKRKYRGVYKVRERYRVIVKVSGKNVHCGYFKCEEKAAEVYNNKAIKFHGGDVFLNTIRHHEDCKICAEGKENTN